MDIGSSIERARGWLKSVRSDRFLPARIFRTVVTVKRSTQKSGPISTLPSELLDTVFELLEFSDRNALGRCMRMCRGWYDLACPHFYAVVPVEYHHRGKFFQYVSTTPENAKHVKVVRLYDKSWASSDFDGIQPPEIHPEPFDIQLLASTLPLLTSIQELSLVGFGTMAGPPSLSNSSGQPESCAPSSLRRLSLINCPGAASIFLQLHSLFPTLDTLEIDLDASRARHRTAIPFLPVDRPLQAPTSVAVRNLVIRGKVSGPVKEWYFFCEKFLAPGCLRSLTIESWEDMQVPMFCGLLLLEAARDLTSISIDTAYNSYSPSPLHVDDHGGIHLRMSIPTVFQLLGATLSQCTSLQHVLIGFVHKDSPSDDPVYRPQTFVHVLTNLPLTLRTVVFRIRVLRWRSWLEFLRWAMPGLSAADLLLAPSRGGGGGGGRFPRLERVELRVVEHSTTELDVTVPPGTRPPPSRRGPDARDPSPLPLLRAAGLLRFVHEVEDVREQLPPLLRSWAAASSLLAEFETPVRLH